MQDVQDKANTHSGRNTHEKDVPMGCGETMEVVGLVHVEKVCVARNLRFFGEIAWEEDPYRPMIVSVMG